MKSMEVVIVSFRPDNKIKATKALKVISSEMKSRSTTKGNELWRVWW